MIRQIQEMKATRADLEERAIQQRIELYYTAHPRVASAVRRPIISKRGKRWIATLGPNGKDGIVGSGPTVEQALRAFDEQYLQRLRPAAA